MTLGQYTYIHTNTDIIENQRVEADRGRWRQKKNSIKKKTIESVRNISLYNITLSNAFSSG